MCDSNNYINEREKERERPARVYVTKQLQRMKKLNKKHEFYNDEKLV